MKIENARLVLAGDSLAVEGDVIGDDDKIEGVRMRFIGRLEDDGLGEQSIQLVTGVEDDEVEEIVWVHCTIQVHLMAHKEPETFVLTAGTPPEAW